MKGKKNNRQPRLTVTPGTWNDNPDNQPLMIPMPVFRVGGDRQFKDTLVAVVNSMASKPEFRHLTVLPPPTIEMQPNPYYRLSNEEARRGTSTSRKMTPAIALEAIKAPPPSLL